jgi:hypothetical protein
MKNYNIKVNAKSQTDFRGARPETTAALIEKPTSDMVALIYQIGKAQIEKCIQAGDTEAAWDVYGKVKNKVEGSTESNYKNPLNVFQKDRQNGHWPFIGAHSIVASLREAGKFLFPGKLCPLPGQKAPKPPAKEHFRKAVIVKPYHIFMFRNDKRIEKPDEIAGQQPSKDVKGFAKYETIFAPFEFEFTIMVNPSGIYEKTVLKDKSKFMAMIEQAAIMGIGGCRGIGYGQWEILKAELIT